MSEAVFGIDLGTTNSVIAWVRDGRPEVIEHDHERLVPSVVGIDDGGRLIVGTPARNQWVLHPDRTVRSIKRRMGSDEQIALGEHRLTPPEISALILKELVRRARAATGAPVRRAVITVPAFFQDAQRQATRTAGEIAGLEVLRIVNEPTAAALAYGTGDDARERIQLVYDLGGGTFDVSLVACQGQVVEVLASHGDVHLGGDDVDELLMHHLATHLRDADLDGDPVLRARLSRAAEEAKIRLSEEVMTRVRQEFIGHDKAGAPLHIDVEVDRHRLDQLMAPLLERTMDCVHRALGSAGRTIHDIDEILLVGGSTRTPRVGERLFELTGKRARHDVHPDLCVAQGAAILAARLSGQESTRVLVDVSPYSYGPSHADVIGDRLELDCFTPLIERNTPLPVTRSKSYYSMEDGQTEWDVRIFQGESALARDNILIGRFRASGMQPAPAGAEAVCRMSLDLDGILKVEVIERATGKTSRLSIEGAASRYDEQRLNEARARTEALFRGDDDGFAEADDEPRWIPILEQDHAQGGALAEPGGGAATDADDGPWEERARDLLQRAEKITDRLADEDKNELIALCQVLRGALEGGGSATDEVNEALDALDDLLYYAEEL